MHNIGSVGTADVQIAQAIAMAITAYTPTCYMVTMRSVLFDST